VPVDRIIKAVHHMGMVRIYGVITRRTLYFTGMVNCEPDATLLFSGHDRASFADSKILSLNPKYSRLFAEGKVQA